MGERDIQIHIGHEEILLRRRYEVMSIINDVFIAVWFVVGSILFLFPETSTIGTWFFLIGSIQFLARPAIRLVRHTHIQRVSSGPTDASYDY